MPIKKIDPSLKLVSEYLKLQKTESFVIPEYQRPYSWEIEHCEKLWQDIEDFDTSGNTKDPYFFGTIIVDCSKENELHLIDGQQRTTTFFFLLKALLLKLNDVIPNTTGKDSRNLRAGL